MKEEKESTLTSYVPIKWQDVSEFKDGTDFDRFNKLKKNFTYALDRIEKKNLAGKTPQEQEYESVIIGRKILETVTAIGDAELKKFTAKKESFDPEHIEQLNQVLYRCTFALYKQDDPENLAQISLLSQQLPGASNKYWKALAVLLFTFAAVALIAGVLLAIPSGGGSVLFSAFAAAKLVTAASVITHAAAIGVNLGLPSGVLIGGVGMVSGALIGGATYKVGLFKNKSVAGEMGQFKQKLTEETKLKENPLSGPKARENEGDGKEGDPLEWRGIPR